MRSRHFVASFSVALALAFLTTYDTAAQQAPPPQRSTVAMTQVKPEMIGTYEDLIKNEAIPALKKAGVPWRWTFASGPFGQGNTYYAVTPVANFAQYDQPNPLLRAMGADGFARYLTKVRPTIVSTHTNLNTSRQDLSILSSSATPPALVLVQILEIAPGKGAEFTKIMTEDFLPAYKKAGVTDFFVATLGFGAPGGRVSMVRPIANFAELDLGPGLLRRGGLSPEAAQQANARRAAITTLVENQVLRFVPALSFGAPAPPKR